jgi:CheY-like chemotaxis protein
MSGLEVAEVLRSIQPSIPIVLMSGFSVQEVIRLSEGIQITGFVQKPFKSADLLTAVRIGLRQ